MGDQRIGKLDPQVRENWVQNVYEKHQQEVRGVSTVWASN